MSDPPNAGETRREFIQTSMTATAAVALGGNTMAQEKKPGAGLPTRPLGKTGVNVSILCLGGWHIGDVKDKDEAVKIMHTAIDEGVDLLRQLLGLPRRRQRGDHGQGARGRRRQVAQEGLPDDQGLLPRRQGGPRADRGQPAAAADRRHRPDADARDQLGQRPRMGGREGRARRAAQDAEGGEGPLRRLHRAQVAAHPPEDAAGPQVGHGADADQRLRPLLPQLRASRSSRRRRSRARP